MDLLKCAFFWFSLYALPWMILVASLSKWFFDELSNRKRPVTKKNKYANEKMNIIQFLYFHFFFIFRAIRTRTVDLLGKTDQTDCYQNDSNCFKDPTCIFLHWALSLTDTLIDINNQLVYHNSLGRKIRKWLHVLGFIILITIQEHYQSVSKKGYPDVGLLLA